MTQSTRVIEFDDRTDRINLDKEIALLELEKNNQITIKNANHADVIRKLYMDLANSLINVLTSRIINASSVLDAWHDLEVAKHWTYLAAKTLEYKFLRPITNLNIAGKMVNMDDVFKA